MQITLNGKFFTLDGAVNITQLLSKLDFSAPLAVEINQEIIPKSTFDIHKIKPGDNIEIVQAIGGG